MRKRIVALALSLAGLAVAGTQAGAYQSGTPAYMTHMYSDETYTNHVGTQYPTCTSSGVRYDIIGEYTEYQMVHSVIYCR
jgi:hypothetical protein